MLCSSTLYYKTLCSKHYAIKHDAFKWYATEHASLLAFFFFFKRYHFFYDCHPEHNPNMF